MVRKNHVAIGEKTARRPIIFVVSTGKADSFILDDIRTILEAEHGIDYEILARPAKAGSTGEGQIAFEKKYDEIRSRVLHDTELSAMLFIIESYDSDNHDDEISYVLEAADMISGLATDHRHQLTKLCVLVHEDFSGKSFYLRRYADLAGILGFHGSVEDSIRLLLEHVRMELDEYHAYCNDHYGSKPQASTEVMDELAESYVKHHPQN